MIPFGLIFVVAGLGVGVFYFKQLGDWWLARRWVETPCVIQQVTLSELTDDDDGGTTYQAEASYSYEYGGRTYAGTKVALGGGSDNLGSFQRDAADELSQHKEQGRPFRCYVDPENPADAVLYRELRWPLLLLLSVFPLAFPLAGGLLSVGAVVALLDGRREARNRQTYAQEPWRWKAAWGRDWIPPSNTLHLWMVVAAALWMGVVVLPLTYAVIVSGELRFSNPASVLALLPFAIWLLVLRGAVGAVSQLVGGRLFVYVEPRPVRPGGNFEAELALPRTTSIRGEASLRIVCERQITTSSGDGTTTSKETLWSKDVAAPLSEAIREARGSRLPVKIPIPAGLPAPTLESAAEGWQQSTQHVWRLEARLPAMQQPATFDLPVFQTEAGLAGPVDGAAAEGEAIIPARSPVELDADELTLHLERCHITATFADEKPVRLVCSPRRFSGMRTGVLIFNLIWTGAFIAMLLARDIPFIFPLAWGVSSALIWWWLGTTLPTREVRLDPAGIDLEWRLAGHGGRRRLEKRDLVGFSWDSNMTSGTTRYYQVLAETTFGKKVMLVDGLTQSLVAEYLGKAFERWRKAT